MLFLCFARRGTGLGCGAESARTLGAGQTPRTGQSNGRQGDHKRSTKISVNTKNVFHKCDTQPAFRKTFLVFTLIFVLLLWSPWRPLLCPVLGVCPAPVVRADTAPQPKPIPRLPKHKKKIVPSPDQVPADSSDKVA